MPQQERREHPRYTMRVPVSVRVSNGDSREISVESKNVSWDGILLSSTSRMPEGTTVGCPASSILSGQRQLEFPILFDRYQQQSGLWEKWEIPRVLRDFQGRWEGRKTCFWFSSLSTARLFPQPSGRRVFVVEISIMTVSWLPPTPSWRPDSFWLAPCGNSGCSVPGLRSDGLDDRSRPLWSSRL